MSELENEIDGLRSRNAELREAIETLWHHCDVAAFGGSKPKWLIHALSNESGKGFYSESEVKPLVEALKNLRYECLATDFNEHWPSYEKAEQALAHWRKDA